MPVPGWLRARMEGSTARLQHMAREAGLPMVSPGVIAYSRLALEATEHARGLGKLEAFHRAVFRKYYGEGQDIGNWAVLRAAAAEAGLDPDAMQAAVSGGECSAALDEAIQQAMEWGITAVPTYILNGEVEIVCAQPYPVFAEALASLGVNPKFRG
jgi:predicted DsbA family dithiol-disulfide isomerase